MSEYHKIQTVFKRDTEGTKKLIENVWIDETVEMLKDIDWRFTEKVDGTNIRVCWDGHEITFKGRTDKSQIPNELNKYLINKFKNNATEEVFEQLFGEKQVCIYGEGYGGKIQNGVGYRKDESFVVFDINIGGLWLEQANVTEIATAIGLERVPTLGYGTLEDGVRYVKTKPKSVLGNADMEGIVARPEHEIFDRRGNRVIVKIKVKDFE